VQGDETGVSRFVRVERAATETIVPGCCSRLPSQAAGMVCDRSQSTRIPISAGRCSIPWSSAAGIGAFFPERLSTTFNFNAEGVMALLASHILRITDS
jgi:hypothetical protein